MLEPINVDSTLDETFLSTDNIAKGWIKDGTPTESNALAWKEDSMIEKFFFASPKKTFVIAPRYGLFFRTIRSLLLDVATNRVPYNEQDGAERNAYGTLENGWTWTMHPTTKIIFKEQFEFEEWNNKREREERKEYLKRRKEF
jgi:hypothetical protein